MGGFYVAPFANGLASCAALSFNPATDALRTTSVFDWSPLKFKLFVISDLISRNFSAIGRYADL